MNDEPGKTDIEEEHFRNLVETLPNLLWICQLDGTCDYSSPQWSEYTGLPESEISGFGWLEHVHPEDRQRASDIWKTASETSTSLVMKFRIRSSDGDYRWFKTRAVLQTDQREQLQKWYASATDIQEMSETQAALQELNQELESRMAAAVAEVKESHADLEDLTWQLKEAQSLANLGSWGLDVETGKVTWSEELFRSFGLDPNTDEPLNLEQQAEVFEAESWKSLNQAITHALETGEGYRLELQFSLPDSSPRWILASGECRLNPNREIVGLHGTAQDITQLKLTQLQLEHNSERMRLATEAARIGIWDFNIESGQLVWDDMMHDLYGTEPETFSGTFQDWASSIHPEDLEPTQSAFQQCLAQEATFESTFRIVKGDGTVKYLGGLAMIHRRQDGSAERAVGVNWDLTEQKQAEFSLRASEHLLRDFVRYAPVAIAMLDSNMRYLQASERWLTEYNLEGQEIIGRCFYQVSPQIPEHWKEIHQRVLAGSTESCDEECLPQRDGANEWLQWEARPWKNAHGRVGGLILYTRFITNRKRMELQLRSQKDDLERSNRDLEQFAYAASHDLQEPLRAVSGCAQILQSRYKDKLDSGADELIQHVVEGASRMQTLILDLLAFSRVGRIGASFTTFRVDKAIDEALLFLDSSIRENQAQVSFEPLTDVTVTGDFALLRQLFQNLVGNAIKYRSSKPPRIQIAVHRDDQEWVFSVQDNGIGIKSEHFTRIFGLFQRLHSRTEHPGTGIGLALCEKIINSHGGRIWVSSEPGHGSIFYFTLPVPNGDHLDDVQKIY